MMCSNISLLSTSSTAQLSVPAAVTVPVQGVLFQLLEQLLVVMLVMLVVVGGAVGRQLDEATSSLLLVVAPVPLPPTLWVGGGVI
jgi:hypothetical protein